MINKFINWIKKDRSYKAPRPPSWANHLSIKLFVILFYIGLICYGILIATESMEGNYLTIFFATTIIGFIFWIYEKTIYKKYIDKNRFGILKRPSWLGATSGIFPLVMMIFIIRGFLYEAVIFPTPSMTPTILAGDIVLIKKFHYYLKFPIIDEILYENNLPQRGDIIAFKFPPNPQVIFGKRIVGLPGDLIKYSFRTKKININGYDVTQQLSGRYYFNYFKDPIELENLVESISQYNYPIIQRPGATIPPKDVPVGCKIQEFELSCQVPPQSYFVMGDNRDYSLDSRYWGFVPRTYIIGKPIFVITNTNQARFHHEIQ